MTLLGLLLLLGGILSRCAGSNGDPAHDELTDAQALDLLRAGAALKWYRDNHGRNTP